MIGRPFDWGQDGRRCVCSRARSKPEAASAGRHNQSIGGAPHHHMSHMHTRLPPGDYYHIPNPI